MSTHEDSASPLEDEQASRRHLLKLLGLGAGIGLVGGGGGLLVFGPPPVLRRAPPRIAGAICVTPPANPNTLTGIQVPFEVLRLARGGSMPLVVDGVPWSGAYREVVDRTSFNSDRPEVARVEGTRLVAGEPGEAGITASLRQQGGRFGTGFYVEVVEATALTDLPVFELQLHPGHRWLEGPQSLLALARAPDGALVPCTERVEFRVLPPTAGQVDADGVLRPATPGPLRVEATLRDDRGEIQHQVVCEYTFAPPSDVAAGDTPLTIDGPRER